MTNALKLDDQLQSMQQYFSYIVTISFIGGENRRKTQTCRKSLKNFIT
jgi:hypothetical protein